VERLRFLSDIERLLDALPRLRSGTGRAPPFATGFISKRALLTARVPGPVAWVVEHVGGLEPDEANRTAQRAGQELRHPARVRPQPERAAIGALGSRRVRRR
jgi:hypothetical protein